MANKKISELTAVTALAGTDVFPVVDVSASTTNKVSVSDLLRNAPDGTEGAPSIANAGDQDTGIFFPAADSVAVSTAGSQQLVIDSFGDVGIGAASPGLKLHVQDGALASAPTPSTNCDVVIEDSTNTGIQFFSSTQAELRFGDAGNTGAGNIIYNHSSNYLSISTNESERLRIDSSGRVGIGTLSPTHAVHIAGTTTPELIVEDTTNNVKAVVGADNSVGRIGTDTNHALTLRTNDTERVRVDTSGNVGIGTTSPGAKLHVAGSTRLGANDATDAVLEIGAGATGNRNAFIDLVGDTTYSDYGLRVQRDNSGANTTSRLLHRGTGDFRLIAQEAAQLEFWTSNTERLIIDSNGRVGIGASNNSSYDSAAQNLLVADESDNAGITIRSGGGTPFGAIHFADGTSDNDEKRAGRIMYGHSGDFMLFSTANSERMRIDSSGNVGIGTTSLFSATGYGALTLSGSTGGALALAEGSTRRFEIYGDNTNGLRVYDRTNTTERLRIDNSGIVKIDSGTNTNGILRIVSSGSGNANMRFQNTTTGTGTSDGLYVGINNNEESFIWNYHNNSISFGTNNAERMRIDSSGRLLIGTTSDTAPAGFNAKLQIASTSYTGSISLRRDSNDAGGQSLIFGKSRGSLNGNTIVQNGDVLGSINFYGADGNNLNSDAARISVEVDGTPGATDMPGRILFKTTADGASSPTERMRIDSSGNVGIGISNVTHKLHVEGSANNQNSEVRIVATQVASGYLGANANGLNIGADVGGIVFKTGVTGGGSVGGSGTQQVRIDSNGSLLIQTTSTASDVAGCYFNSADNQQFHQVLVHETSSSTLANLYINRQASDGRLIEFRQADNTEGTIDVNGSTVSYNGAHLSRWSQPALGAEFTDVLRGSVLSNTDEMCEWAHAAQDAVLYTAEDELPEGVSVGDVKTPAADAYTENNEQLNRMKVSDVEGDVNVSGVFQGLDNDEEFPEDFLCAMTGDFIIRIAQGTTVARGDLLMSAGDGTAKPQDDDIVRSKTIAKVTSTTVSTTYADGSYCVPCVLMAC